MGLLSDELQELSDKILNDPEFKNTLRLFELSDDRFIPQIHNIRTVSVISEVVLLLIDDLLTGRKTNAEILNEIRDDTDLVFYLPFGILYTDNKTDNEEAYKKDIIKKIKAELELVIDNYQTWESNLKTDNYAVQQNTISEILSQYGRVRKEIFSILDHEYRCYNIVALSFLLLAVLSNTIGQAKLYISNIAPRFIKYFDRAGYASLNGSLAHQMVSVVMTHKPFLNYYNTRQLHWTDGRMLTIKGNLQEGFTYNQTSIGAEGELPPDYKWENNLSVSEPKDWINKFETARKGFINATQHVIILQASLSACKKYKQGIKKYLEVIS